MIYRYNVRVVYHIAKADFLERIRSYNFLITIGAFIFLIYSFVPALDAGYTIVSLGNYRGFYNSAWIGSMVASCVPFFALIGFYLVNYAVKRDIDTGVGQIIATTRISNVQYLAGKLISNFAVLLFILILIAVMTIIMFLLRGETGEIELDKLLLPLLILAVPAMFIIASLALFFDSLTGLNRGMANIIYFFLWIFLIGISTINPFLDIFSINTALIDIKNSISGIHPDWNGDSGTGILIRDSLEHLKVFYWEGISYNTSIILSRIFWMSMAFCLVLLGSIGFKRFASSERSIWTPGKPPLFGKKSSVTNNASLQPQIRFRDAPQPVIRFNFINILRAEVRLLLKGNSKLWLIISFACWVTSLFAPLSFSHKVVLPLLWFFQILVLSKLGSKEITERVKEYIFSYPYPLIRQLPATIAAATLFLIFLALPVVSRLILTGDFYSVYAILTGALFIASLATSLGILSGGSKFFEIMLTLIVYGSFNGIPIFDLTGSIEASREWGFANYLLLASIFIILLSFAVRKRQISYA